MLLLLFIRFEAYYCCCRLIQQAGLASLVLVGGGVVQGDGEGLQAGRQEPCRPTFGRSGVRYSTETHTSTLLIAAPEVVLRARVRTAVGLYETSKNLFG